MTEISYRDTFHDTRRVSHSPYRISWRFLSVIVASRNVDFAAAFFPPKFATCGVFRAFFRGELLDLAKSHGIVPHRLSRRRLSVNETFLAVLAFAARGSENSLAS